MTPALQKTQHCLISPARGRLQAPGAHAPSRPPLLTSEKLAARLQQLVLLFHRRWAAPILAQLLRGDSVAGGAKFITLANRLGLSRDSLQATLDYLIEHDLVIRNPGYGHPMRPEYILAEAGYDAAPACERLMRRLRSTHLDKIGLRKWSMPVMYALGHGIHRFGQLKPILPRITSRALALALKDLSTAGLVERQIIDRYPPAASYQLTQKGKRLLRVIEQF